MCGQQPPKVMGASWGKTAADLPSTPIRVTAAIDMGGCCGEDLMWPVLLVALDWLPPGELCKTAVAKLPCRTWRAMQFMHVVEAHAMHKNQ